MSNFAKLFIYQERFSFSLIGIIYFLFLIIILLFKLPLICFLYPFFLSLVVALGVYLYKFKQNKNAYYNLDSLKKLPLSDISDVLEKLKISSLEEKALINILLYLNFKNTKLEEKENTKYDETVSYILSFIHQVKIPLTTINLIIEEDETNIRLIKSELLKLEHYLKMILTYFQMESVNTDYVFKKIDVKPVVLDIIKRFSPEFIYRGIGLNLGNLNFKTLTDQKWFSFILEQILSNALKYTNEGEISIKVLDDSLVIKDTGIGINKSDLPRIFERGYTGYNGRGEKNSSGLGLYLVQRVANILGITVKINSEEDKGTEVILKLVKPGTILD